MNDPREKDIQALCNAVLYMSAVHWDNPNGAYESSCPICHAMVKSGSDGNGFPDFKDMDEIKHKFDCAYLIAKDLSTKLL